ncbi:chloride channel protein [Microlunatus elymi]|uniref:Chloride channel protein n=1 Tax=Microlunatus elymi TaxID=2596828 RepID=A0A516Q6L9_9ACTN|nr:chloride channel protein [Microlunatus elymi]
MLVITAWALPIGALGAVAAWLLQMLIGVVTNAVFYHRWDTSLVAPGATHHAWWLVLLAPIAGGLVVGLMARYGSEKIRGHGMPEAIESILVGGSRVEPKVAGLKPISAAVSIGTGGPFGAEGPIIMTGGAIGSILAQHFRLTADERKTLLVAGAAAGMAATFNSPLAAVLLAVELLLFEWRPRSFVPVVAAVVSGTVVRGMLIGTGPIFPVPHAPVTINWHDDALAVVVGISGALVAYGATRLVYFAEDLFRRLPIHWMWWPAIGGLIIGLGGLVEPRALGVGYDVIDQLLTGHATIDLIIGILVVKTLIWSLSLGSGTSGGVLAPTFMIGGALGAAMGLVFPSVFPGFWAMLGLAAVVGGVMRSPLTGVVFTLELTHAWDALVPLLVASVTAYAVSVLVLKRSVLTEKIARRGLHLSRDYTTDPLETFFAADAMRTGDDAMELARELAARGAHFVVGERDTLRHVAYSFAQHGHPEAAVLAEDGQVLGHIDVQSLLTARLHDLTEATERTQVFRRPLGIGSRVPG